MRIKSCTDFVNEGISDWFKKKPKIDPNDIDANGIPDFLYHSTEPDLVDNIMENGLFGYIFLASTPEEALIYHPVLLKIDVRFRRVRRQADGWVVKNIPVDQIQRIN